MSRKEDLAEHYMATKKISAELQSETKSHYLAGYAACEQDAKGLVEALQTIAKLLTSEPSNLDLLTLIQKDKETAQDALNKWEYMDE